jgi:CubicO group peptidase (beta-lactamase class C family)
MRRENIKLSNWREHPNSKWAFQHVTEVVPCALINSANTRDGDPYEKLGAEAIENYGKFANYTGLQDFLGSTHTNGFIVSHKGRPVASWYADHFLPTKPHLLFSVSKSITATVAGILQAKGLLDVNAPVSEYLELPIASAYFDCTVQHVLDMTVALDFDEDYTSAATDYIKYRQASGWNPVDQTSYNDSLRSFILPLKKRADDHGNVFRYRSPNSDLLGMILASAAKQPFPQLMEQLLWKPMCADSQAWVTVDHRGDARTAGGICTTIADLSRLGQLISDGGLNKKGERVLSAHWIEEVLHGGNADAWQKGDFAYILPNGKYRNKWYQYGNDDNAICAMGIHGQYLYINPTRDVVISKVASQPLPVDEEVEPTVLKVMDEIARQLDS